MLRLGARSKTGYQLQQKFSWKVHWLCSEEQVPHYAITKMMKSVHPLARQGWVGTIALVGVAAETGPSR